MTSDQPRAELDTRFSDSAAQPVPWSEIARVLEEAEMFWLSTVRSDGRPHVTPLPAMWLDGNLHFCTGESEQKKRNLDIHPRCVLTTGCNSFRHGLDIIVEGQAERVTEDGLLRRLAGMWLEKLDWRFDVADGGFRDPQLDGESATALVFCVEPRKVLAFSKGEPFSQTRYRF